MTIEIRDETAADFEAVARVNAEAFGRDDEADLVAELRITARPAISLVAAASSAIVGHIFFSPVRVGRGGAGPTPLALGPLAVLPAQQGCGIGSRLSRSGLDACRQTGAPFVVVLGHPTYYPRFGFESAAARGLFFEDRGPADAFMVFELAPGGLDGVSGSVHYLPAFSRV